MYVCGGEIEREREREKEREKRVKCTLICRFHRRIKNPKRISIFHIISFVPTNNDFDFLVLEKINFLNNPIIFLVFSINF